MRGEIYQYTLIALGVAATLLFGLFFYRELFPEYKIYQEDYIALEEFRSTYTGEPVTPFPIAVKQIVIEREDKGPAEVDRCISCHVALKLEHFSPTILEHDINGNLVFDERGWPKKIPNPNYIWKKLDEAIAELLDPEKNEQLVSEGKASEVKLRRAQAERYQALKVAKVGDRTYDVTKVLRMHPLIGREVRPFQYHSMEDYGCVSCHGGNGRGLTTEKAHGPVFDEQYEVAEKGYEPHFTESDPGNDPAFARVFNHQPGHSLLFQTTPIFVGGLIEAKCVQCHQPTSQALQSINSQNSRLQQRRRQESSSLSEALNQEEKAFITLTSLQKDLQQHGYRETANRLQQRLLDPTISDEESAALASRMKFLESFTKGSGEDSKETQAVNQAIEKKLLQLIGTTDFVHQAQQALNGKKSEEDKLKALREFIQKNADQASQKGSLFQKTVAVNYERALLAHIEENSMGLATGIKSEETTSALFSDIDALVPTYRKGAELFINQACYACHRIAGLSRGGVGPELTQEGYSYPWFIKESIVWPQADLKSSTMPNYRLDHEELEALMAFLLAQRGPNRAISQAEYKTRMQEWESGKKAFFEEPIDAAKIQDIRYAMRIFATEGCAACHRLKGFESNVGFKIEKEEVSFQDLYREKIWFQSLIPEAISGKKLVDVLEKHGSELDERIISDVRQGSILEEIEKEYPGQIEALYTPFKFAQRAKNQQFEEEKLAAKEDSERHKKVEEEQKAWQERIHRVLMIYIQEYGLGRVIGPRPNYSGIYRSDEWLMEHFRNPSSLVAHSIMPIFPFDTTKFYALTYMLDVLAKKNRDALLAVWQENGFNPAQAYRILCSDCHGEYLQGNGPVSAWIYPIPKNLRNAEFLRNLTRQNVIASIYHGVKGTPMPPWGEVAQDKPTADGTPVLNKAQIEQLANWLFSSLPGATVIRSSEDVPKWQYKPEDVLRELKEEGGQLRPSTEQPPKYSTLNLFPSADSYWAALDSSIFIPRKRSPATEQLTTEQLFDVVSKPDPANPEQTFYYIKHDFYTPENLNQGRLFFEENCAVCHGRDADGAGNRAGAMQDAKPRMLINFPWIETRDDLRLLRSIKYGVQGTSMQPWGDFTTSLQRLQLVMYIRSLNQEQKLRSAINETLYQRYNRSDLIIEQARASFSKSLDELTNRLDKLRLERRQLESKAFSSANQSQAAKLYQEELGVAGEIERLKQQDQLFVEMRQDLAKERELFQSLGNGMISQKNGEALLNEYLTLVSDVALNYSFDGQRLEIYEDKGAENAVDQSEKRLLSIIEDEIQQLDKQVNELTHQPDSAEKKHETDIAKAELKSKQELKKRLIADLARAKRLHDKQRKLLKEIYSADKQAVSKYAIAPIATPFNPLALRLVYG